MGSANDGDWAESFTALIETLSYELTSGELTLMTDQGLPVKQATPTRSMAT